MSTGAKATRIVAHRGGALLWPENSLTAFRGALALGVDLVEVDVHQTRDGEVVVIHDPTLERTTTGRGAVGRTEWARLGGVVLRGTRDEGIPRLRDVLDLVRPTGTGLLVEIKLGVQGVPYPGIEEAVLRLLEDAGLRARVAVMALEWETLARLKPRAAGVRLAGLLSRHGAEAMGGLTAALRRLTELGAVELGVEQTLLSAESVAAIRAAGLGIGVFTLNDPAEMRRALALGVDSLTTDRPDLALTVRAEWDR